MYTSKEQVYKALLPTAWQLDNIFNKYASKSQSGKATDSVTQPFNYEYWLNEYQNAVKKFKIRIIFII